MRSVEEAMPKDINSVVDVIDKIKWMIFNNKISFMVHYLATAGLLLGQKSSFFAKNHTLE